MPFGFVFYNGLVQFSSNAAGHGDYHCLAVHNLLTLFKMRDNIFCNLFNSVSTAN